jgi:hypothetical protein
MNVNDGVGALATGPHGVLCGRQRVRSERKARCKVPTPVAFDDGTFVVAKGLDHFEELLARDGECWGKCVG